MKNIKIKRAIVSVYDKNYLSILAEFFLKNRIEVLSTGGTFLYLKDYNSEIKVSEISEYTGFNEILDGRVKSLHPVIHAGILAKKNNVNHQKQLERSNINFIDLVVVNLYPFEEIINKDSSMFENCIENIDIGGPTLIRGAAKNFQNITVLSNPKLYQSFVDEVENNNNTVSLKFRKKCAKIAFEHTSYYESIISNWFSRNDDQFRSEKITIPAKKITKMRYGENPHQSAALFEFYPNNFLKISGKDISYNNINDIEIAAELSYQFSKPCCVILKHGNPCGVALHQKQDKAYSKALNCDKISAFGGIVSFNKEVSYETAQKIDKIFTEIVIAPKFSEKAKSVLMRKQNLILVQYKPNIKGNKIHLKSTNNFLLVQSKDVKIIKKSDLDIKSILKPKKKHLEDMIFAFIVSKYINSNAIVLAKNLSTISIGVGQTNRLEAAEQAIRKMKKTKLKTYSVMASDGFFPFPDIVKLCAKNKIIGIIQPGGSKNDNIVIKTANKNNISLVFTGIRHFKH